MNNKWIYICIVIVHKKSAAKQQRFLVHTCMINSRLCFADFLNWLYSVSFMINTNKRVPAQCVCVCAVCALVHDLASIFVLIFFSLSSAAQRWIDFEAGYNHTQNHPWCRSCIALVYLLNTCIFFSALVFRAIHRLFFSFWSFFFFSIFSFFRWLLMIKV